LRHALHRAPELSGHETETAERIQRFLEAHAPNRIITGLGGQGVAAVYEGRHPGPTVLLRADLDALPIRETVSLPYGSLHPGVSHKCGHDGHMSILAGVGARLARTRPGTGRVVLLFQPAEETGEGAAKVLNDSRFSEIEPDMVFALHNLPGYPEGCVVLKDGVFASASIGLIVELSGRTSHAGQPHHGISPASAMAHLIQSFAAAPQNKTDLTEAAKVTVIHARLGEKAFGTSPGEAHVMATLRATRDDVIDRLRKYCSDLAAGIGGAHGLSVSIASTDAFPVTRNHSSMVQALETTANALDRKIHHLDSPFPWSEDFGHFTARYPGAIFGLGAGRAQPALHHPEYDFPDRILPEGVAFFTHLIHSLL